MEKLEKSNQSNIKPQTDSEIITEKQSKKVITAAFKSEFYSGPLPPPEIIERYEKIYPDAPRVIFDTFESQHKHRIYIENKIVDTNINLANRGQIFGFILSLLAFILGFYLISNGLSILGSIFSGGSLIALISLFIYGRISSSKINFFRSKKG